LGAVLLLSARDFSFRRQAHAYRYPTGLIVGMVVLGICLGGLGLYATRLPERIQTSFPRHLPPRVRPWFERERPTPRPEDGVLFGRIREIKADHLLVNDPPGHLWRVIVNPELLKQGDFIRPGQTVIIQGRIQAREVFEAHSIRPYQGRPGVPPPRMK
jgi:hypothetical protein